LGGAAEAGEGVDGPGNHQGETVVIGPARVAGIELLGAGKALTGFRSEVIDVEHGAEPAPGRPGLRVVGGLAPVLLEGDRYLGIDG
jgi:hypothetical protein